MHARLEPDQFIERLIQQLAIQHSGMPLMEASVSVQSQAAAAKRRRRLISLKPRQAFCTASKVSIALPLRGFELSLVWIPVRVVG
jgi:hypothetical protein